MRQSVKGSKNSKERAVELLKSPGFSSIQSKNSASKFKFGSYGNTRECNMLSFVIEPLDFEGIPPNLVVIFKNICKRDNTTRIKGLEDLSSCIDEDTDVVNEENVLKVWSYLYPRLSIDMERQVRLQCNQVHGKICVVSGKRIVRVIKEIIGPWMMSNFDSDYGVKKVSIESFNAAFQSEEKRIIVKKVYQKYIISFNRNIILKQSPNTLSDVRYVSQEDSKAKYYRIISSILASLADIILNLELDELKKEESSYDEIMGSEKFWKFLYETDLIGRKHFYQVIKNISEKWPELLISQKNMIKKSVTKLMKNTEKSFISIILPTMEIFFSVCPELWGYDFFGDSEIFSYFKRLILNNDFDSTQFWNCFYNLITKIPLNPEKSDFDVYLNDFIKTIWDGASKKTKYNNEVGFETFFKIMCFYMKHFENTSTVLSIFEKKIMDIIINYFTDITSFSIKMSDNFRHALVKGFLRNEYILNDIFNKFWCESKQCIFEKLLKTSNITSEGNYDELYTICVRWINTADEFNTETNDNTVLDDKSFVYLTICEVIYSIICYIRNCDDLYQKIVELLNYVLSKFSDIIFKDQRILSEFESFIMEKIPRFITSLTESIGSILLIYILKNKNTESVGLVWASLFSHLSRIESGSERNVFTHKIVKMIIDSKIKIQDLRNCLPKVNLIDDVLLDCVHFNIDNNLGNWECLNDFLTVKEIVFSKESIIKSLIFLVEKVFCSNDSEPYYIFNDDRILVLLHKVLGDNSDLCSCFLQNFQAIEFHIKIWNFVYIKKGNISERISIFNDLFEQIYCLNDEIGSNLRLNIASIIQKQILLLDSLDFSLMRSLCSLSVKVLSFATELEKKDLLAIFLFPIHEWDMAFSSLISEYPNKNLELFNSLKTCCLIFSNPVKTKGNIETDNISKLLKISVFSKTIINFLKLDLCSLEIHWTILYGIMICEELIRDNFELEQANCLWKSITKDQEQELFTLIEKSNDFVFDLLTLDKIEILGIDNSVQRNDIKFLEIIKMKSIGSSPETYYSACVLSRTLQFLTEKIEYSQEEVETWLNDISIENNQNVFIFAAIINGFQEKLFFSKRLEGIRNRIGSDLSGDFIVDRDLKKIILFNIFIPFDDSLWKHFPQQRIIFLFQNLLKSIDKKNLIKVEYIDFCVEITKIFIKLIPFIKTIDGVYWYNICDYLCECLRICTETSLEFLNFEFYSMKLFMTLSNCYSFNDSFNDSWNIHSKTLYSYLFQLFIHKKETYVKNQPLDICIQLLSRILLQIPIDIVQKPLVNLLYLHLLSQWKYTQIVTFDWLTNWILKDQENLIIETEFSKEIDINLPSELLFMISDLPCYDTLDNIDHENNVSSRLRGYFLSWILIFTYFKNTSYILKSSYIESLKNNNCIPLTIEFIFKTLELLTDKPINTIEILWDILEWKNIDNIKTEMLSLIVYVYLLILRHIPSLARDWWIGCKNRQLTQSVETFTEKNISSILIEDEIASVLLESMQLKINDDNIHVKTSKTTREVTTSYTIDDQYLEMVIRLPACYPLNQVIVEGVQKIGVKDAQWRAWLLASRILITTQNGSIADAVSLFKRNVSLHFEGVVACNICFSIISVQDRSLPSKKCATCKNKFHSGCLYKWFKTSNTSKCPLCRTTFSFSI
ncbi:hypothetical protein T552_01550 [Pneumocystis carinii B80]|uniref:E3 ubiquitin-protein ligase listerin n=1 Tax=Pneumocystis carinii (strain B80) TaxID=1408658 RepID=A0A0W4ZKL7_PNEC8|nr:hypothetical protein T552_01550 [Pneumocystis carinii B80]KTW28922.1 hypothetical protein T552_01550 [Pneumocystis carinii B80]